ncbi:MAG: HTH-type transcriptional regulator DegA [Verrucomicrobiae bacterium]|nr:HTH-type transcriptional regulator DegA [Verrucomicrobiae bacterium]
MAITQKDLARQLGVAQVTVSRALRQDRGVNESLRRRILNAAERHGYSLDSSNLEARRLRSRAGGIHVKTNVICAIVITDDDPAGFGGRIVKGMNDEGAALGTEIVTCTRCRGKLPLIVARQQVDGVIRLLGDVELTNAGDRPVMPWVSVLYEVPQVDLVTVDNFHGADQVGQHLCRLGHRRIGFIGPDTDLCRERLAGLRAAAAQAGATVPDECVRLRRYVASEEPTRQLLTEFLGDCATLPFTALVAYNDYMADIALHYVRDHGRSVPGDLSLAGFDGVLPSRLREQAIITTAAIPLEELGRSAVRLLSWRLQSPEAPRRKVVLETAFVAGDTSGPPRGG